LRIRVRARMAAHQHCQFRKFACIDFEFVHVAAGDQTVVGRNGRAERQLVVRVADLRQRLHGGIAALAGKTVFARNHQNILALARIDQARSQHDHGETGRAADLHSVAVARLQAEVLREQGAQHEVRQRARICGEHGVDICAFRIGALERARRCLRHERKRGFAGAFAEARVAGAAQVSHIK